MTATASDGFFERVWKLTRAEIVKEHTHMDDDERDLFTASKVEAQARATPAADKLWPARAGVFAVWTHRVSVGMVEWDLHVRQEFDIIRVTTQGKLF